MKNTIKLLAIALLAALTACSDPECITGSGNIITDDREVSGFTTVVQDIPGEMYITQGNEFKLAIKADDNILGDIRSSVHEDELYIGSGLDLCNVTITTYITLPEPEAFSLSGSGDIICDGSMNSGTVSFVVDGSGDIRLNDVHSDIFSARITGTGDVTVRGESDSAYARIDGTGGIYLKDFETRACFYSINGSGDIYAWVNDNLNARISGTGDIYYLGDPENINARVVGVGGVHKLN
jgi:hypothetical protein